VTVIVPVTIGGLVLALAIGWLAAWLNFGGDR
jgi:hypothetical protein